MGFINKGKLFCFKSILKAISNCKTRYAHICSSFPLSLSACLSYEKEACQNDAYSKLQLSLSSQCTLHYSIWAAYAYWISVQSENDCGGRKLIGRADMH